MAETVCAISGIDPLGKKKSCNVGPSDRFKGANAAFPRAVVESEVRRVLEAHIGKLQGVNEALLKALMDDAGAIPCPEIRLPKRYAGGLLFGQLVPRFDNRIISTCPVTGEKVPNRKTREFLDFRWGMQMANVKVAQGPGELRRLSGSERQELNRRIRVEGRFTALKFKEAVRETTGCKRDNLDTMLMHPDAAEALMVDPVQQLVTKGHWASLFPKTSEQVQKRARGKLWHGKKVSLGELRDWEAAVSGNATGFDDELAKILEGAGTRTKKKEKRLTREEVLQEARILPAMTGRAPYSRKLMAQAFEEVLSSNLHPKEKGGCLFITEEIRKKELNRRTEEQTNNHLIRHRLLILERLLADIVKEYAGGDKSRIAQATIEVNRDLREMSGKTAKEIQQDLGQRLANHSHVVKKLEEALGEDNPKITAGLIRKARIADDLGWKCPYTGKPFDALQLAHEDVDKDHIIPRSQRPTDSLESLVITFKTVNAKKGKRTALQFVEEEGGREIAPGLSVMPVSRYKEFVEKLEAFKGHEDDKRRKKRRKELMLLGAYEEKEFTPRDLTVTSHLVRMGAQKIERFFQDSPQKRQVIALPGAVTGAVRKAWSVLGCLEAANAGVLDETGALKTKTEIRDVTHLHHAVDACVLGFAAHYIPNNGRVWELIAKRTLLSAEEEVLKALGIFTFGKGGRFQLRDLGDNHKDEMRRRLAEMRVAQHIPADLSGLACDETVYRLFDPNDTSRNGKRLRRWFETLLAGGALKKIKELPDPNDPNTEVVFVVARKRRSETGSDTGKTLHDTGRYWRWVYQAVAKSGLHGIEPDGGEGKLKKLKAVKLLGENYGVAWLAKGGDKPEFFIIRPRKAWRQLADLKRRYASAKLQLVRRGDLIQLTENDGKQNVLRIFGTGERPGRGIYFDVGRPDSLNREREIQVSAFAAGRVALLKPSLAGIRSCPITSSASTARSAR